MFTNMPEDVITNTFHFFRALPEDLDVVADTLTPLLSAFYSTAYDLGIAQYLNEAAAHVNWYDLSEPPPRAVETNPLVLDPSIQGFVTDVPTEVAAVLSFQGIPVSGTPQARRRGRIYLGALIPTQIAAGTNSAFPTIGSDFITDIVTAASTLKADAATAGFVWSIWSPTDQGHVDIDNGWVDNSPDTQRRRSVDATARTTWS
jgi:hypothetical protein